MTRHIKIIYLELYVKKFDLDYIIDVYSKWHYDDPDYIKVWDLLNETRYKNDI